MNDLSLRHARYRRRLLKAMVAGSATVEPARLERTFGLAVRRELALLPPCLRRALTLMLTADEAESYGRIAEKLSATEGRRVSQAAARQRVSRALRRIESGLQIQTRLAPDRPKDADGQLLAEPAPPAGTASDEN